MTWPSLRSFIALGALAALAGVGTVLAAPATAGAAPWKFADPERIAALLPRFVTVPPGSFRMGSAAGEPAVRDDERPAHEVVITQPYAIATTEVTRELWRAVLGEEAGYFADCAGCPVESVSWYQAVDFCNRLSIAMGLEPVYLGEGDRVIWNREAGGYRLPTEAEWERACRAGSTTRYHTGDCLTTDLAAFNGYEPLQGCPHGMNRGQPVPVGSFPPNAWGLHDMHGNVDEWCWNAAESYPDGRVADPSGPEDGRTRCFRGGGWFTYSWGCRSAVRYFVDPASRFDFVGLRLARTLTDGAVRTEEGAR